MQPSGGIDEEIIDLTRHGRLDGIESHRRGIRSALRLNDLDAGARFPHLKLLHGGGAKGVGGCQQDFFAL